MHPLVSIIIPVYNVKDYIQRCLESIINQSLHEIEIIIVDDCGQDESISVAKAATANDERVKFIHHERNRGLMQSRKSGYSVAKGDYITFCDSDDYLPLDAIEKMYEMAISSGADVVCGQILATDNGKQLQILGSPSLSHGKDSFGVLLSLLQRECGHNLCGKLFKKELLQNYEYKTFENFINGEDACLFYQIVPHIQQMEVLSSPVYYYSYNESSSSRARYSRRAKETIIIVNSIRLSLINEYPELKKTILSNVSWSISELFAHCQSQSERREVDALLKEHGLSYLLDPRELFANNSFWDGIKILLKKKGVSRLHFIF